MKRSSPRHPHRRRVGTVGTTGHFPNELARRCGITSGYLSHLMNGRHSPSPMVRWQLMEVLGVDDFHIYGGAGNDTYDTMAGTDGFYHTKGNDIIADYETGEKIWACIGNGSRDAIIAQADSGSDRVITITHNNAIHGATTLGGQAKHRGLGGIVRPQRVPGLSATTRGGRQRSPQIRGQAGTAEPTGGSRTT